MNANIKITTEINRGKYIQVVKGNDNDHSLKTIYLYPQFDGSLQQAINDLKREYENEEKIWGRKVKWGKIIKN